ncbi:MAG: DUF3578 domain-containing protein [Bacillota bacterium]|nr:DUF3578 domain-containing protein [Bacillota bacterium]
MKIVEVFREILDTYLESIKEGKFNKNHPMFQLVNYKTIEALSEITSRHNLSAKGSCGNGVWTRYPWIAIYYTEITNTIQKGIYVAYLFSEDMSRVYLTLNQGCTKLKSDLGTKAAKEEMIRVRTEVRQALNNRGFETDNDLRIGNIDYEIGSIFYREYKIEDLNDEEKFIEELNNMIELYGEYYKTIFLKNEDIGNENLMVNKSDIKNTIETVQKYINYKGFIYSYEELGNFYLSLKTKPFVILAGISGTGKSRLVKLFSEAINGKYFSISVKPDWNDNTELFGYKNINDEFIPGKLTEIIAEASKAENSNKPYFICLDEMNLARVEYYLSEYLSLIESRDFDEDKVIKTDMLFPKGYLDVENEYSSLIIPDNVYIIGTVNMDDTTFAFSRKVLDRANTIEFSEVNLDILDFNMEECHSVKVDNGLLKSKFINIKHALAANKDYVQAINEKIIAINNILGMGNKQFGYRVRDEIVFYMLENKINGLLDEEVAFDYQIMQKVLPTITGSEIVIRDILIQLYNYCNPGQEIVEDIDYIKSAAEQLENALYLNSAKKIIMMLRGYEDGFVSYWA